VGLPPPDAVFIGGGLSDPRVVETAWQALKPGGRLVANAVSLASEAKLIELFQRRGGELVRLDVSRAGKAGVSGSSFVWRPAAPIVQWRVRKP
jgi:precorrin-6Y C5,15-methyltransferase (decarboxylating)